jgi:hypothetical protein
MCIVTRQVQEHEWSLSGKITTGVCPSTESLWRNIFTEKASRKMKLISNCRNKMWQNSCDQSSRLNYVEAYLSVQITPFKSCFFHVYICVHLNFRNDILQSRFVVLWLQNISGDRMSNPGSDPLGNVTGVRRLIGSAHFYIRWYISCQ